MDKIGYLESESLYAVVENDILYDKKISSTALRVYCVISSLANNRKMYCFLTIKQIADRMQLTPRQVINCINQLLENKYILKIENKNRSYFMPFMNRTQIERKKETKKVMDYDWLNEKF